MTFLEAAIEIQRNADGAMHFSEVARIAVEQNLLSHVGRDPEAAMRSCLHSAVRKPRDGEEPIIMRDKPVHYGIRPGAALPEPPPRPEGAKPAESNGVKKPNDSKANGRASKSAPSKDSAAKDSPSRRTRAKRDASDDEDDAPSLEFEAPTDAG